MAVLAGMQKKIWHIRPASEKSGQLARLLKISPITAQVLINRQITDAEQARAFLSPKLTELIEPDKMPGIAPAVERIKRALADSERFAIYGDYDVDGITGVAILWHLLTILGGQVEYYIPHRIDEGYGLNAGAIKQLAQAGVKLIITVDCGITAAGEAALVKELGVELVITDHHQADGDLPQATAIVHPGLEPYANPDSAGATVALKLAWALVNEYKTNGQTRSDLREFLLNATTLAAMGTIADVVDLRGENRILANYGLKALNQSKLVGISALIRSAQLDARSIDSYDIAFRLAPMLNAAGRMGHARLAVELLTSQSEMRCYQIAEYLKDQNNKRRQCQRKMFKQVRERITTAGLNHPDKKSIVLADDSWHTGVVGIVASRVVDQFFRPAILINTFEEIAQGSARSVEGFNIHAALSACSDHLVSFGGHEMAAGLKLGKDKVEAFAQEFEEYARQNINEEHLESRLNIDAVCSIRDLNVHVVKELLRLEPFGQGNPAPVFASRGVRLISPPRRVGVKGDHLQVSITDNTASVRCIGFGMGNLEKKVLEAEAFNIAYEAQIDTYNGGNSVQLVLQDIQFE
ncbi:MAG TPA: single-stranded-DNA-specific exonuclease RecJ [Planctomycetes bacterium]|nr:single-stranded-DNA-specific exonuclease RecJ [Planctomycetota bacterium]